RVKMKAVRYSVLQKGQTLVASILLGCPYTSSINHRLVPDSVAAREWGMERFPDQSQVNLFLNRIVFKQPGQRLVIRLDAGYGNSHATVDALLEAQVGFLLKWRDSRVAKKIVREHQLQWQRHTREVRVAEGPSYLGVRSVICEVKGEL